MPEIQFMTALWTVLRVRHREMLAASGRPADAGSDVVQYVIITAALAVAAVVIVGIIVHKVTSKATSLQTE